MKKKEALKSIGIRPLADRILLRPISDMPEKTKSGIIIPETISKEKPEQGVVIAVGPGKYDDGKLEPLTVKKGDVVLFSKYGYDEIKIDGEEYFILREDNILAILD
jgi:chaperonin GroES